MSTAITRLRLFPSVSILALAVLLAACGSDGPEGQRGTGQPTREQTGGASVVASPESPSGAMEKENDSTPGPVPESVLPAGPASAAPTPSALVNPGAATAVPPGKSLLKLSADAKWGDAFETFSDSAQSCIRDELGQEQLGYVLERRLLEGDGAPWEVAIFGCLDPDAGRHLMLWFISANARQAGINVNEDMEGCWTRVISTIDVAAILTADHVVEEGFSRQIRSCLVTSAGSPSLGSGMGMAGLLGFVPLTEQSRLLVWYNDYVRAQESNGIESPLGNASDEDLRKHLEELQAAGLAPGPWISGFSEYAAAQLKHREYLGFSIGDIEQSILAGEPPNEFEVATGHIDPGATSRALTACDDCPGPETHEHLGVKFYSWGEDYTFDLDLRLQPPVFDELGRGGRVAVLDSLVFRTLATQNMWSLIETYRDGRDSLANDPDLLLAAGEMDAQGVYSALLFGNVEAFSERELFLGIFSPEERDRLQEIRTQPGPDEEKDEYWMDRFTALGTGVARDADGFHTILIFVYEDEDMAASNLPALKERLANWNSLASNRPWTEHFPQSEVWNDGRALIARLRTDAPRIWVEMVFQRDNLLLWNG